MSILLIADLHLNEERPDITAAFLSFLKDKAHTCEALYILGDFFHLWVGDDAMGDFEKHIAKHLKKLAEQGTKIYLMHGNRDFTIGKTFCQLAGCKLLKDPFLTQFYRYPVLLSHGDILCTKDIDYQKKRRFYRNPLVLFFLKLLPLRRRLALAAKLRAESKSKKGTKPEEITDVTPEAVVALLEKYKVQWLIHGHTHRPAIHELTINGQTVKRFVLGDWEPNGMILKVTPTGFQLEPAIG